MIVSGAGIQSNPQAVVITAAELGKATGKQARTASLSAGGTETSPGGLAGVALALTRSGVLQPATHIQSGQQSQSPSAVAAMPGTNLLSAQGLAPSVGDYFGLAEEEAAEHGVGPGQGGEPEEDVPADVVDQILPALKAGDRLAAASP